VSELQKGSFQGGEIMSMLILGVSSVPFIFSIVLFPSSTLMSFPSAH
jgi:hypothetical protein